MVNETTLRDVILHGLWGLGIENIPNTISELTQSNLSNKKLPYFKMIADVLCTRAGDLVFLYQTGAGFHGIFEINSDPFYDCTRFGSIDEKYPIRFFIKKMYYFKKPVPEDYLFSKKDYESIFWTWFYRKAHGARGMCPVPPEAAQKLVELIVKFNDGFHETDDQIVPYSPIRGVHLEQITDEIVNQIYQGSNLSEDALRVLTINHIRSSDSKDIQRLFGNKQNIEWLANEVPYHISKKSIDILCYHSIDIHEEYPLRYRYSVVELKRDDADERHLSQLIGYAQWVAERLADGDREVVQPILIARRIDESVKRAASQIQFNRRGFLLSEYQIIPLGLQLKEVS